MGREGHTRQPLIVYVGHLRVVVVVEVDAGPHPPNQSIVDSEAVTAVDHYHVELLVRVSLPYKIC